MVPQALELYESRSRQCGATRSDSRASSGPGIPGFRGKKANTCFWGVLWFVHTLLGYLFAHLWCLRCCCSMPSCVLVLLSRSPIWSVIISVSKNVCVACLGASRNVSLCVGENFSFMLCFRIVPLNIAECLIFVGEHAGLAACLRSLPLLRSVSHVVWEDFGFTMCLRSVPLNIEECLVFSPGQWGLYRLSHTRQ